MQWPLDPDLCETRTFVVGMVAEGKRKARRCAEIGKHRVAADRARE